MGSGKSTLSRLIAGILQPTEGSILIDGVDVNKLIVRLRKNIVMLQDSWLFSGTIEKHSNGINEYDDAHLLKICKVSGVDDFIEPIQKVMTSKLEKKA